MPSIVGMFASMGVVKQVAIAGENRQLAETFQNGISRVLDEYCGTPHGVHPWPPPPTTVAFELASLANAFPEGRLRMGIADVANQLFQKSVENVKSQTS